MIMDKDINNFLFKKNNQVAHEIEQGGMVPMIMAF